MTLALRLVWRGSLWGPPVEPTPTIDRCSRSPEVVPSRITGEYATTAAGAMMTADPLRCLLTVRFTADPRATLVPAAGL